MEDVLPPITVACWAEFAVNPSILYNLFDYRQGKLFYDSTKVMYLTMDEGDDFPKPKDWIFTICNEIELAALAAQLLTKRILMKTKVVHTKTIQSDGSDRPSTWEATLAVLVNTQHSSIKVYIDNMVELVSKLLTRKRRFCVAMDISNVITDWYTDYLGVIPSLNEHNATRSFNSRIYITNHKTVSHLFDCSPAWCLFGPLCWLSSAPCYFAYRRATCVDDIIEIKAELCHVQSTLNAESES